MHCQFRCLSIAFRYLTASHRVCADVERFVGHVTASLTSDAPMETTRRALLVLDSLCYAREAAPEADRVRSSWLDLARTLSPFTGNTCNCDNECCEYGIPCFD